MIQSKRKLDSVLVFIVIALLLLLHMSGVLFIRVGDKTVFGWEIFIPVLILLILPFFNHVCIPHNVRFQIAIAMLALFILVIGLQGFRAPKEGPGLTALLRLIALSSVFMCTAVAAANTDLLRRLNIWVFVLGIVMSVIALALFVKSLGRAGLIYTNSETLGRGIGYYLDRGVIRLRGLEKNPNGFAAWAMLSLFVGLSIITTERVRRFWQWVSITIVGIAILLSGSRGTLLAFIASSAIVATAIYMARGQRRKAIPYLRALIFIVTAVLIGILLPISSLPPEHNPAQRLFHVAVSVEHEGRLQGWNRLKETLISDSKSTLLFGHGTAWVTAELGLSSHNLILDVLLDYGLIGLLPLLIFFVLVTLEAFQSLKVPSLIPWAHSWLFIFVLQAVESFLFGPVIWLIAGILFGGNEVQRRVEFSCKFQPKITPPSIKNNSI